MYFLKGGMDIFVGKNQETEAWKGFASCPRPIRWSANVPPSSLTQTPACSSPFNPSKGTPPWVCGCVCQPSPSPDYLLAEVCKKVIFPSKLAFRTWRLNKRTCDQFIAQGWRCSQPGPQLASPSQLSECGAAGQCCAGDPIYTMNL